MKVPTPGDCPGFVYGFMDEKENNIGDVPYWIKMGMTKLKVPQNRIFQWDKTDQK